MNFIDSISSVNHLWFHKAAQHLVAEHYERDFSYDLPL